MTDKKSSILVVDDESGVRSVLTEFLSLKGYDVSDAKCGEESLELLKNRQVDLILLDIVMPGLKGTEVAKIVKTKYPSIKIVMITAFPEEGEGLFQNDRLEAILIKPFRLGELYKKLEELFLPAQESGNKPGLNTKGMFLKAAIMLVTPSLETHGYLCGQIKELAYRSQHYTVDVATDERVLFRKLSFSEPDIVIFDEAYLKNADYRILQKVKQFSEKTKKIFSFDLVSALYEYTQLQKLLQIIRETCIEYGLVEIG